MSGGAASKSVLDHLDPREAPALAEALARIPTAAGDEAEAADHLAKHLRAAGFDEVTLQEVERGRPNLIATLRGDGSGARFMLEGHLDTDPVPEGEESAVIVEGDRLRAPGVGDAKAGVAALVAATTAVRRARIALKGDLVVACTMGGLQGGIGAQHLLAHGAAPDAAIVAAPTGLALRTTGAGAAQLLVTLHGRAVWIGQTLKFKWVNAIEKALDAASTLRGLDFAVTPRPDLPGLPRLQIGGVRGGLTREYHLWRPAFVADCCSLAIDLRLPPGMATADAIAAIKRCLDGLAAADADFRYELELAPIPHAPPWGAMAHDVPALDMPKDHPLVRLAQAQHERVTGKAAFVGADLPGAYGASAAGYFWAMGVPCLAYGPAAQGRFGDEVALSELVQAARVLALTAAEIATRPKDALGFGRGA